MLTGLDRLRMLSDAVISSHEPNREHTTLNCENGVSYTANALPADTKVGFLCISACN